MVCEKCFYTERKRGLIKQFGILSVLIIAAVIVVTVIM
jgi:hypothetical protein